MAPAEQIDYILNDCFLAVGQAIGTRKSLDPEALGWWRARYRVAFMNAMIRNGNSWERDRDRVTAVGRFLGERALFHAAAQPSIDLQTALKAAADVEAGCRMNAVREGINTLRTRYASPS
jgi:hypothetical protein